ncbi:unnamed protein product [Kuraishia capsulata CBS 1993]|uniref:C2H2-type domain-containing protein n=1 Tax=Kuraishia capsulata CBS 1993 TaxID=1382522 RepID=W6ML29_9ASCO|nr:uncharacterized protein KUCA_T00002767001 [Kuraishia capsulata CBS 1993]CDK26793.1 unnamed protein product [Kuraishia capsulata CBS 1993]
MSGLPPTFSRTQTPTNYSRNGTTPSGKPRLFVCAICTRAFARQEHLKRHERSHTKEKPFSCGVCSRKFSRRDLLLRHAQKLHVGCSDVAIARLRKKPGRRGSPRTNSDEEEEEPDKRFKPDPLARFTSDSAATRRASFSAMSGPNYAMPPATEVNFATETVEFSTPQLLPHEDQEDSWLTDPIPTLDSVINGTSSMRIQNGHVKPEKSDVSSGYSFYDVPSKNVDSLFNYGFDSTVKKNLSPLTQLSPLSEEEEDMGLKYDDYDSNITELGKLTDMNASKNYKLPTGYSFYGTDQQTVPNSSTSSNATISPILLDSSFNPNPSLNDDIDHKFDKYSRVLLFTNNLRGYIYHSLSKYPFIGIPSPTLPDNDRLNAFTASFEALFLNHHPFIHKSLLNEYSTIKMILTTMGHSINPNLNSNETIMDNTKVSFVCLPLLIATIGAVVSNRKAEASNLYEASRRCIHVYLDSRKKKSALLNKEESSSPLWLIQSLTLSIIYGLFADNDISLNVIIRQVNALSSLIKSSNLNTISFDYASMESANTSEAVKFDEFIRYESTVRTIHTIFHISSLLSSLYNIVPSLKIDDLFIDLPCSSILWDCMSAGEFGKVVETMHLESQKFNKVLGNLISFDFDMLDANGLVDGHNFFFENNVSEFGLVCLQDGLHQYNYFHQLTELNTPMKRGGLNFSKIVSNWDKVCDSNQMYNRDSEILFDSKLLNRFLALKTSPVLNLNRTKESLWLKSWNEMYLNFSKKHNYKEQDFKKVSKDMLSLVKNSIEILKLVFFKPIADPEGVEFSKPTLNTLNVNEDQLKELSTSDIGELDFERFSWKLSLNLQILFDVVLSLVKFLANYEGTFKARMRYKGLDTNLSFVHHFQLSSTVLKDEDGDDNMEVDDSDEAELFGLYESIFKIYLNLEFFLKVNYGYNDFESEFSSLTISSILSKKGTSTKPKTERDLMINELISFKLPSKLLKIGEFLFNFIYDKNLKFINFKNLSNGLFHLRISLENNEDYADY